MKSKILLLCVSLFLITNDLWAQNEIAGFLGRWLENGRVNAKKESLPRVTWLITADEKTLTLIEFSEQGKEVRQIKVNLDGTETPSISRDSTATKDSVYKFKLNKRTVEIRGVQTVSGLRNIPPQKYEIQQKWELADGGKTLKVEEKAYAANPEIRGMELFSSKQTFQRTELSPYR